MDQDRVDVTGRHAEPGRLDEGRLALEFGRLKLDRQKASVELLLKRREFKAAKNAAENKGWKEILGNPLTLAVVGGFITLMTTTLSSHFSSSENIAAETVKAREALQADLIKKFVDNPNPQAVRANLQFLVDVGLVPTYAKSLQSFLEKNPNSALPSSSGVSGLPNVHSDDDAIDLVIRFEGGSDPPNDDPALASKFGISLSTLTGYLGKPASIDDLRNLSVETARDIYKKLYLGAATSAIASVQVKAAYLGLSTNMGTRQANKLFQDAIGKVDGLPIDVDGVLGPQTVQRINAIDSNLLIETANCGAAKYYESLPTFAKFGVSWLNRLRAFSPVTLKGICPELQPNSSVAGTTPSKP